MVDPIKIPSAMLEMVEENQLATWAEKDACRNFPNCVGEGEKCNAECPAGQWGDG